MGYECFATLPSLYSIIKYNVFDRYGNNVKTTLWYYFVNVFFQMESRQTFQHFYGKLWKKFISLSKPKSIIVCNRFYLGLFEYQPSYKNDIFGYASSLVFSPLTVALSLLFPFFSVLIIACSGIPSYSFSLTSFLSLRVFFERSLPVIRFVYLNL